MSGETGWWTAQGRWWSPPALWLAGLWCLTCTPFSAVAQVADEAVVASVASSRVEPVPSAGSSTGSFDPTVLSGPITGGEATQAPPSDRHDRRLLVVLPTADPKTLEATILALGEDYRLRKLTAWDLRSLSMRCVVFEAPRRLDLGELLERLDGDRRVHLAQTVRVFTTHQAHEAARVVAAGAADEPSKDGPTPGTAIRSSGDPYRRLQHALGTLRLDAVHRHATGKGVRLAVIDTGIDADHPDLEGRVTRWRDLTGNGRGGPAIHGTAVAGVIAAGANSIGILGVAPEVELLSLAACWPERPGARKGVCDSLSLAVALDTAMFLDADIVNLSLGGPPDPLVGQLVETALDRGLVVVAADDGQGSFPARLDGVLGVGMLDAPTQVTGSGDAGRTSLLAPGRDILSTVPGGAYDFFSGASLATAQVAGIGALLRQVRPGLDTAGMASLLRETAKVPRPGTSGCSEPCVPSSIDACAALAKLTGSAASPDPCGEPRLASAP